MELHECVVKKEGLKSKLEILLFDHQRFFDE